MNARENSQSDEHLQFTRPEAEFGSQEDVTSVASQIDSREIQAITIAGEPFTTRRHRLLEMAEQLKARIEASEHGRDLMPLLKEIETALEIVDRNDE